LYKQVRIGIVGCGVIGQIHMEHAVNSPLIRIEAVADMHEEAARQAAQKFGAAKFYTNADDLFNDPEVDAVVLALQTSFRTELALKAFAKGKHVLLEKPVAMNANEVERMLEAKGNLLSGCCSSRFRFTPSAAFVEDFIRSGNLGVIRVVRSRVTFPAKRPESIPPLWSYSRKLNGGGVLADWGVYDLDYLLGLTGWTLRPKAILGRVWGISPTYSSYIAEGSDAETHVAASVLCEGGELLQFERGSYVTGKYEESWQIIGEEGTLDLDLQPHSGKRIVFHKAGAEGTSSSVVWEGDETWDQIHAGPIQDFAEAIITGREPKTSLRDSLTIQGVIDGIYKSSESRNQEVLL
jgi:UDP-N-acetyl-2-amino-2-deoxyglucuronate dehydrogenase